MVEDNDPATGPAGGDLIELQTLSVNALKTALLSESTTNPSKIPVVCVDEYTALQVLSSLGARGYPVFPMNSKRANQDEKELPRRELPQYYCSIAIKRGDPDFQAFMEDALVQFLSTEVETTADAWFRLAWKLVLKLVGFSLPPRVDEDKRIAEAKRWRSALEWVYYTLSLDNTSIAAYTTSHNLPWKPILVRARQRMQVHLAADKQKYILSALVDLFWDEQSGINADGIDQLCHLFDVGLTSVVRTPETSGILVDSLRNALLGTQPALKITVRPYDLLDSASPGGQRAVRTAVQFMRSLQNMYYLKRRDDAVAFLQTKIDQLDPPKTVAEQERAASDILKTNIGPTAFGGKTGRFLIARVSGEQDPIGGGFLSSLDSGRCELSYLWVETHYRDRRVGEKIIERAISVAAQDFHCTVMYAEVIREILPSAASLFLQMGFIVVTVLESGRTVFERPI